MVKSPAIATWDPENTSFALSGTIRLGMSFLIGLRRRTNLCDLCLSRAHIVCAIRHFIPHAPGALRPPLGSIGRRPRLGREEYYGFEATRVLLHHGMDSALVLTPSRADPTMEE